MRGRSRDCVSWHRSRLIYALWDCSKGARFGFRRPYSHSQCKTHIRATSSDARNAIPRPAAQEPRPVKRHKGFPLSGGGGMPSRASDGAARMRISNQNAFLGCGIRSERLGQTAARRHAGASGAPRRTSRQSRFYPLGENDNSLKPRKTKHETAVRRFQLRRLGLAVWMSPGPGAGRALRMPSAA